MSVDDRYDEIRQYDIPSRSFFEETSVTEPEAFEQVNIEQHQKQRSFFRCSGNPHEVLGVGNIVLTMRIFGFGKTQIKKYILK